ncbi:MAG: hypothetical protein CSA31_03005, partial [Desulfobulbus propionicus]
NYWLIGVKKKHQDQWVIYNGNEYITHSFFTRAHYYLVPEMKFIGYADGKKDQGLFVAFHEIIRYSDGKVHIKPFEGTIVSDHDTPENVSAYNIEKKEALKKIKSLKGLSIFLASSRN